MESSAFAADFRELMEAWNKFRSLWIAQFGSDDGFSQWFSSKTTTK